MDWDEFRKDEMMWEAQMEMRAQLREEALASYSQDEIEAFMIENDLSYDDAVDLLTEEYIEFRR